MYYNGCSILILDKNYIICEYIPNLIIYITCIECTQLYWLNLQKCITMQLLHRLFEARRKKMPSDINSMKWHLCKHSELVAAIHALLSTLQQDFRQGAQLSIAKCLWESEFQLPHNSSHSLLAVSCSQLILMFNL